jgi:hypothetical protein
MGAEMPERLYESKDAICPACDDEDGQLRVCNMGRVEVGLNKVFPCEPVPAFKNKRCDMLISRSLDPECKAIIECGYADIIAEEKRLEAEIKSLKMKIAIAKNKKKSKTKRQG